MKNKKGGNKTKKQKNLVQVERKLELKDENEPQEYAQIKKMFGNSRFEVECFDGQTRLAHARGILKKKKVFVKLNDIVVVSLRDFQDNKCDIIYVYNQNEVKQLKKIGEIPNSVVENEHIDHEVDIGFDIEDTEESNHVSDTKEEINIDDI